MNGSRFFEQWNSQNIGLIFENKKMHLLSMHFLNQNKPFIEGFVSEQYYLFIKRCSLFMEGWTFTIKGVSPV